MPGLILIVSYEMVFVNRVFHINPGYQLQSFFRIGQNTQFMLRYRYTTQCHSGQPPNFAAAQIPCCICARDLCRDNRKREKVRI